jgi:hypothetical protein
MAAAAAVKMNLLIFIVVSLSGHSAPEIASAKVLAPI